MVEITLNHRRPRDENRQVAYISISGVNAKVYRFRVGDVPIELTTDQEVQDHLESRKDELHLLCLIKTYPGADVSQFRIAGKTDLEIFLDWIDAGHKNKIQIGLTKTGRPKYNYEIIEKRELECRHPKWIGLLAKIDALSVDIKTKELLREIIKE